MAHRARRDPQEVRGSTSPLRRAQDDPGLVQPSLVASEAGAAAGRWQAARVPAGARLQAGRDPLAVVDREAPESLGRAALPASRRWHARCQASRHSRSGGRLPG
ncbi:MAG: hypothetical protein QG675_66 [Patescibacteria group bacterium]|nr:hypothetical protein [Patescibacteria group bacterium]